jgi:delta-aminolevulinic acid dehydratase/porphobilinogen synthase
MITGKYPALRLRRNRRYSWSRKLIQEKTLGPIKKNQLNLCQEFTGIQLTGFLKL